MKLQYPTNVNRHYWDGIDEAAGAILGHGALLQEYEAWVCRLGSVIINLGRPGEGLGSFRQLPAGIRRSDGYDPPPAIGWTYYV